ncbi:hypothetical protein [Actinocorallia aurantiaca]|uniref:Uncharacterized protein n=1 Tax=Actinocorallia aurantiaca TaxID=46204 RepID=A0ABN3U3U5_9ACTN
MDISSIPKPDDFLLETLRDLGGPFVVIAGILAFYFLAKAWIDAVLFGGRAAGRVGLMLRLLVTTGLSTTAGMVAALALTGMLLLVWVVLSDLLANFMGYAIRPEAFGPAPGTELGLDELLQWPPHSDNPYAEAVAQYVLWSGLILAAVAVIAAFKNMSATALAFLVVLPWLPVTLIVGLLALSLNVQALVNWQAGKGYVVPDADEYGGQNPLVLVGATAALVGYVYAAFAISNAPAWARSVWTKTMSAQQA